jgi:hypothetical protein
MVQNKHDIIRQIQQGKVKTALEGIVKLSGLARDKEIQQRCLILQSQLSQLESNFGMGTFDQKTYQLEQNRITQAALDLVYMLPDVVAAPPQYQAQGTAYNQSTPSSSGWKTWGIMLTGAVGLMVVLLMISQMMNMDQGNSVTSQPGSAPVNTLAQQNQPTTQSSSAPLTVSKIAEPEAVNPHDKFVGSWSGSMSIAGMVLGGLNINLRPGNRYTSAAIDPSSGAHLASDAGSWSISENGFLVLQSDLGNKEVYSVHWNSAGQFNATFVDGTNAELAGLTVSFSKL